jgi:hypothetical protein
MKIGKSSQISPLEIIIISAPEMQIEVSQPIFNPAVIDLLLK